MSIVKGIAADIRPEFLEKLERTFSTEAAAYREGDTLDAVAFRAGQRHVVNWIKRHGTMSPTAV
ncbi:hypothetical protein CPT_Palo_036 [Rhizobium phage Palo]|uniref:Uncharacterized protein n=1 Tax=Rhizobium phage Palo TaxID=2767573 RepID=A0A7L8G4K4_9CAUD|nr:hypothetical protein CPT_Palo_036 [Rhizobium phage Palo]